MPSMSRPRPHATSNLRACSTAGFGAAACILASQNPLAAQRAGATIKKVIQGLAEYPQMGRPMEDMELAYRELLIGFGESGYVAVYRYSEQTITITAVRHQREMAADIHGDETIYGE